MDYTSFYDKFEHVLDEVHVLSLFLSPLHEHSVGT